MTKMIEVRGIQDGAQVFGFFGPEDSVRSEAARYALLYASEGDVELQEKSGRKWKTTLKVAEEH